MTTSPTPPHLPLLFLQAQEVIAAPFRPIVKQFGLTEQQWRTLRVLYEGGPLEPCQLCDVCHFHSSSITGVLARMEEAGLIRKERMTSDHRRVLISLTDKSRALVEEILPLVREQYRLLSTVIGETRLAELQAILESLVRFKDTDIPQAKLAPRKAGSRAVRAGQATRPAPRGHDGAGPE